MSILHSMLQVSVQPVYIPKLQGEAEASRVRPNVGRALSPQCSLETIVFMRQSVLQVDVQPIYIPKLQGEAEASSSGDATPNNTLIQVHLSNMFVAG